jgi:hypothetical protein
MTGDKNLALKIVQSFDKEQMDILNEVTDIFIKQAHLNLEGAQSFEFVTRQQGIIFAMKKIKNIRDDALTVLKEKSNG